MVISEEIAPQSQSGIVWAIACYSGIASGILMMAPSIASQVALEWHAGPEQIGNLFSIELGGMSLATVISWLWLSRVNWRVVAMIATTLFIIANLVSGYMPTWHSFIFLRFIASFSAGTIMIITIASGAQTKFVQKTYSYWVLSQLLLGAAGLAVLPYIFAYFNLAGCYIGLAILAFLAMPLLGNFPSTGAPTHILPISGARQSALSFRTILIVALPVLSVFLFYVGLSGVWTFVGTIAERAHIENSYVIFSFGTLMGVVGSAIAGFFPKSKEISILLAGYLMMAASVMLFCGVPGMTRFVAGVLIFKFAWTFVLPWILSFISRNDHSGKLMSSINLVIGGGFAIGPFMAGKIIQAAPLNTSLLFVISSTLLVVSLVLLLGYRIFQQKQKGE